MRTVFKAPPKYEPGVIFTENHEWVKYENMTPRISELRKVIALGIAYYDEPGHGYYIISPGRLAYMQEKTPYLLTPTSFYQEGQQYFEHDCEWSRVVLAFPFEFKMPIRKDAHRTMANTHPKIYAAYMAHRGIELLFPEAD